MADQHLLLSDTIRGLILNQVAGASRCSTTLSTDWASASSDYVVGSFQSSSPSGSSVGSGRLALSKG